MVNSYSRVTSFNWGRIPLKLFIKNVVKYIHLTVEQMVITDGKPFEAILKKPEGKRADSAKILVVNFP